jgi:hypothetical protein
MRQQLSPPSQPPPADASQHISSLWSELTQVQPQDPAYSPVVPRFPAEPRPLVLTQPGAGPAQSAEPRRLAEFSPIDLAATALQNDLPTDSNDRVNLLPAQFATEFPTRSAAHLTEVSAQLADRPATSSRVRVRTHTIPHLVVLEVASRLSDVVEDLDQTIQLALADEPRGVVCDLSALLERGEPGAVEKLATAGRHVSDWPAIPVVVACPDPQVCSELAVHPLGRHLIVTASMLPALSAALSTPTPARQLLRIGPHPTAPRAARDFVTRTLLDWKLGRAIPSASLVVGELVASSLMSAGTDIELSVVWNMGVLRLSVRDHGPDQTSQRRSHSDLYGRPRSVVAGLSRAFGTLPTAEGGKAVWAVLNVPPQRGLNRSRFSGRRVVPAAAAARG